MRWRAQIFYLNKGAVSGVLFYFFLNEGRIGILCKNIDHQNQRTIFEPDASCSEKRLKANQPKNFSYPKKKFGKKREVFIFLVR